MPEPGVGLVLAMACIRGRRLQAARTEGVMRALWVLLLLVVAGMTLTGCEAIQGIFKAGVWTGVIMVAILVLIIGFIAAKLRA